jgi:hypothetical protein
MAAIEAFFSPSAMGVKGSSLVVVVCHPVVGGCA